MKAYAWFWVLGVIVVAGCDADGSLDPAGGLAGTVVGRIESTGAISATAVPNVSYSMVSGTSEADVVVAAPRADGSLDVLAEGRADASGRYRVEGVPAGRDRLVVVAKSGARELGRAIVHERIQAQAEAVAEPITAASTVRAMVFSEVIASGTAAQAVNTAELAMFVRMDEGTARAVAASRADVQAIARGYIAATEAMTRVLAQVGTQMDARARFAIEQAMAAAYTRTCDEGVSAEAAHEVLVRALVDGLLRTGARAEGLALAAAGGATGLAVALEHASEQARLEIAKAATELNLEVRQRILASLPPAVDGPRNGAASALVRARTRVRASLSLAELEAALEQAAAEAEGKLTEAITSSTSQATLEVRSNVRLRLETAVARSNLSAELSGSASAQTIADAIARYRAQVRATVEALVAALPDQARVDVDVMIQLLVAIRGGPCFD